MDSGSESSASTSVETWSSPTHLGLRSGCRGPSSKEYSTPPKSSPTSSEATSSATGTRLQRRSATRSSMRATARIPSEGTRSASAPKSRTSSRAIRNGDGKARFGGPSSTPRRISSALAPPALTQDGRWTCPSRASSNLTDTGVPCCPVWNCGCRPRRLRLRLRPLPAPGAARPSTRIGAGGSLGLLVGRCRRPLPVLHRVRYTRVRAPSLPRAG